ncbi:MAG: type II secretion system F family protein [Candidatus Omnitrophica bacterium]|nr:type II secretion system F family protein [Candidatus Omnitrophota bacterium]
MPRYSYIAKTLPQTTAQGNIEAESEQDAINKLAKMGYFPISVSYEAVSQTNEGLFSLKRVSRKEIFQFTRQLSSLIESGVNILNALNIISNQTSNKRLSVILADISGRIKDGKSLSDSLAVFPALFPGFYCAMVRVGEASGGLNTTLKRLADFLEADEEFKDTLRAGMTYPFFIFMVSALTVVVLLVFVIPRLVLMFEDMGQVLPLPTRILISASEILRNYWWLFVACIGAVIFSLRRLYKSAKGRFSLDRFKLKMAVFGQIVLKTEIARACRTLSLLLSSGIPITPALEIAVSVVENQVIREEFAKFKEKINSGQSLSSGFRESKIFPEFVVNIVAIGEETGSLDASLMRVAQDYERETDRTLKSLTRLLEPVIILVMGLIVGFIVLSMLLPIFQINIMAR